VPQPPANSHRGEIWLVDLNPTRGHEQAGPSRPCLVVSANELNLGPAGLVIVVPITKTARDNPFHISVSTIESGLSFDSAIMCDQVRAISKDRLIRPVGKRMTPNIMMTVEDRLKILFNIK
jgi:mRNA interferase MazF